MLGSDATRSDLLLKVTNGMEKFSDDLEVRTQSPVQKIEQQKDKSN
jgi:hypothetical protein